MHIIQDEYFLNHISSATVLHVKRGLNRVYMTTDHDIIKVFYNRSNFKKAQRLAKKFIKNATTLHSKKIKTVVVSDYKEFPNNNAVVISYRKLPGKTILEHYKETKNFEWLLKAFDLLNQLHAKKIYFHDFHAENIIFDESTEEFALIDVQSIKFPWYLTVKSISENFNTFFNYLKQQGLDVDNLRETAWQRYLKTGISG